MRAFRARPPVGVARRRALDRFWHSLQITTMPPSSIRVRDVVRDGVYDFGPDEPVLRVPYDLFQPVSSIRTRGTLIDWIEGDVIRSGRVARSVLGDTRPGERVLLRLPPPSDEQWWLCEVEAVDGVAMG